MPPVASQDFLGDSFARVVIWNQPDLRIRDPPRGDGVGSVDHFGHAARPSTSHGRTPLW